MGHRVRIGRRLDLAGVVDTGAHAVEPPAAGALGRAGDDDGRGATGDVALQPPVAEATLDVAGQVEHAGVDPAVVGDPSSEAVHGHPGQLLAVAAGEVDEVDDGPPAQPLGQRQPRLGARAPHDVGEVAVDLAGDGGPGRPDVGSRRRPRPPRSQERAEHAAPTAPPGDVQRHDGRAQVGREQGLLIGRQRLQHDDGRHAERADVLGEATPAQRTRRVVRGRVEEHAQHASICPRPLSSLDHRG